MRIESRFRRLAFTAAAIFGSVLYLCLALQPFLASHFASFEDQRNLQRAIRIEPSNAEYHDKMGEALTLAGDNPQTAVSEYELAVHLDPYSAHYWLDLANAYLVAGRAAEQQASFEQAILAEPTTPDTAWEVANFFLLQGNRVKALNTFRVVLANDPGNVDKALRVCWRATGDANEVLDRAVPRRADVYLAFLHLLMEKEDSSAAETVWNRLVTLKQSFTPQEAFPYLHYLLMHKKVAAAQSVWRQLGSTSQGFARYLPTATNLVVNGGFEEKILNGGFDWLYHPVAHVDLAIDSSEFHSGSRSLSITFDGQNPSDTGIVQCIPVKSNSTYTFSAAYKTEEIMTASGPRFSITDAYTNISYLLTDDFMGSSPWRLQQAQFKTGPDTHLVMLRITRSPPGPLIRGRMWIDDIELVQK